MLVPSLGPSVHSVKGYQLCSQLNCLHGITSCFEHPMDILKKLQTATTYYWHSNLVHLCKYLAPDLSPPQDSVNYRWLWSHFHPDQRESLPLIALKKASYSSKIFHLGLPTDERNCAMMGVSTIHYLNKRPVKIGTHPLSQLSCGYIRWLFSSLGDPI